MKKVVVSKKEIEEIFDDFIKETGLKIGKKKNFNGFIKFLELDIYDWIKENLRCYFKE